MGNIFTEMDEMLGKLRRNEEQMTEAQKKQYAVQLLALKKRFQKVQRKFAGASCCAESAS